MIFDGEKSQTQTWSGKNNNDNNNKPEEGKEAISKLVLIGNDLDHELITDAWFKCRASVAKVNVLDDE
jgi:hypothetical protein